VKEAETGSVHHPGCASVVRRSATVPSRMALPSNRAIAATTLLPGVTPAALAPAHRRRGAFRSLSWPPCAAASQSRCLLLRPARKHASRFSNALIGTAPRLTWSDLSAATKTAVRQVRRSSSINSDGKLRLLISSHLEIVQTQVCCDQEEVLTIGKWWKAAMIEKGWR
jgi:hypothetical protein